MQESFDVASGFAVARSNGTNASPTQVLNNQRIGGLDGYAHDDVSLAGPTFSYRGYATQTQTTTAHGSKACIATTPDSTTSLTDSFCQFGDGGAVIGGPTGSSKGAGTLNVASGFFLNGTNIGSEFVMSKQTAAGTTAPGAGFCKLKWVAGTTSGTGKLMAYCGTSTTGTAIVDNVGAGF